MPTAREKRERNVSGLIRFAAAQIAVAGWLAMTLPSTALTASYRNDFRSCAGRLTSVDISANEAASACAAALNPRNLARCVVDINRRTSIAAEEALSACRQERRPNELANCVVGISRYSQEENVPGVLDYCGRSLLPERFAECVVGLRREIDIVPTQAMENCIAAGDQLRDLSPTFVPEGGTSPIQSAPATPSVPRDLTPLEPNRPPSELQNQTPPTQQSPVPTAPANPGSR